MRNEKDLIEERDKIVKGLELAYERLLVYKKQINSPMIVLKDGKITAVDPNKMPPTTLYNREIKKVLEG